MLRGMEELVGTPVLRMTVEVESEKLLVELALTLGIPDTEEEELTLRIVLLVP